MPTQLVAVKVDRIALVARPANRRGFLLLKAEDMPDQDKLEVPEEMLPALKAALVAGDEEPLIAELAKQQEISGEDQNKVRMALRLLATMREKLPADALRGLAAAAGYGYPAPKSEDTGRDRDKEKVEMATQVIKSADGTEYSVPEEAAKVVEMLVKSADDLRSQLGTEVAERKRRDAMAKCEREYPHLDREKTVALLLKAETVSAEFARDLDATLAQAEALAVKGFGETGSSAGGEPSGAEAKIEAGARALLAKSASGTTYAQAYNDFLRTPEGKALYKQHVEESRSARSTH